MAEKNLLNCEFIYKIEGERIKYFGGPKIFAYLKGTIKFEEREGHIGTYRQTEKCSRWVHRYRKTEIC